MTTEKRLSFEHVKLINVNDVLHSAELRDLGRVNVICGKNNSGKTTVINAIGSDRIIGKTFSSTIGPLNWLPLLWFPKGGGTMSQVRPKEVDEKTGVKGFPEKYAKALKRAVGENPVWFADELSEFVNQLTQVAKRLFGEDVFQNVELDIGRLWAQEFQDQSSLVVVPPKRRLSSKGAYSRASDRKLEPDGFNLLSHLYWLKNLERNSKGNKSFRVLSAAFEKVSAGHTFNITRNEADDIVLRFALRDHDEIAADDCGLGLQDLLVILYFALEDEHDVVLVEEPENHIHPEMQRRLLRFLAEETDKQYFITTHSNIFLNSTYVDRVFFTEFSSGKIQLSDVTSRSKVLHNLGYSVTDNLVSDLIILVEGSSDKAFIEEYLSKYALDAKYSIKIWILGGDEMTNQDLSVFGERYLIMALVDKDPQSAAARQVFEKNCKKFHIDFTKLKRYSVESYFSKRALDEVFNKFNKNLPEVESLSEAGFFKCVKSGALWDKLGTNPQRRKAVKTKLKRNIREVARLMTLEEIAGTDMQDFFDKVIRALQAKR